MFELVSNCRKMDSTDVVDSLGKLVVFVSGDVSVNTPMLYELLTYLYLYTSSLFLLHSAHDFICEDSKNIQVFRTRKR